MRIAASIAQIDNHESLTQLLTNVGIELLGELKSGFGNGHQSFITF